MTDATSDQALQSSYREWLVKAEHDASRDYDRAVMALAGGALGLSITFIREVVPSPVRGSVWWLGLAWICLILSLLAILLSILASQHALRKAIAQVDDGSIQGVSRPGGWLSRSTEVLNVLAAIALVAGLTLLVVFALLNYRGGPQ